jgi:hypothetical protein
MVWEVEVTDEFRDWYEDETSKDQKAAIAVAVEKLEERGPSLPRPFSDTVKGSKYTNLKELRPQGTNIRILYIFDPRRCAILLTGGDKTGWWNAWYHTNIPVAESHYDVYLQSLREEGLLP